MLQIPKDILTHVPAIRIRNTEMYGIYFQCMQSASYSDILQTSHCLEIVLSGQATVRHGEIDQTIFKDDIQFRKRGNYQINYSEDFSSLQFFLENEFIEDFLRQHIINYSSQSERLFERFGTDSFPGNLPPFLFRNNELIGGSVAQAINSITIPATFSSCLVRITAHQILLQILSMDKSHSYVNFLKYLITDRKAELPYFMEANFRQNMSLKDMARLSGRSESAFKKDFRKIFHCSPFKWLLNRRLEYAHYLLRTTTLPVSEIMTDSAFENLSHFSRAFKDKYGYAPTQARITK